MAKLAKLRASRAAVIGADGFCLGGVTERKAVEAAETIAEAGLVEAAAALPAPERLQARVGIATGLVVVGNLAAASPEHEVVGEAPNLRPIWW